MGDTKNLHDLFMLFFCFSTCLLQISALNSLGRKSSSSVLYGFFSARLSFPQCKMAGAHIVGPL